MITTLLLFCVLRYVGESSPPVPPPRLELRVFDANCEPARVDSNRSWRWDPPARILYCVHCPRGERPETRWETLKAAGSSSPGRGDTIFFVEPGERYVYAYVGKEIQTVEGEVTIAPNTPLTVRELRVEPNLKTQTLRVHPTRADGSPLAHDFQVSVESLVTGLTLFRSERDANESRYGDVLPVGRYRVRVETEENPPGCASGWQPEPAPFGDWVEVVDLTSERPVEIEAAMWFAGKLRVGLDVPRGPVPREESWRVRFPTELEPPEMGWLSMGSRGPGARVTLRADPDGLLAQRERGMPDFASTPVRFFFSQPEFAGFFALLQFDVILPGDAQTSADWIPPGAYIARIEARDFEPVEAKVWIQIDETTELRVELTPR